MLSGERGCLCRSAALPARGLFSGLHQIKITASKGLRPARGTHPALSLSPKAPNLVLRTNGLMPQAQSLSV